MQALLAQLASEPGDTAANAARAAEALESWPQADIAVFPELFLGGYGLDVEATARPAGCDELHTVAQAGADLLVTASANMEPFYADHELATRARALENRLPHLYANAVGTSGPHRFVGGSRSIGPDGTVVAELPAPEEGLLLARVGDSGTDDERVDYLRHLPEPLTITTP